MITTQVISCFGSEATVTITFDSRSNTYRGSMEIHSRELAASYARTCLLTNDSGAWDSDNYILIWAKFRLKAAVKAFESAGASA